MTTLCGTAPEESKSHSERKRPCGFQLINRGLANQREALARRSEHRIHNRLLLSYKRDV